MLPPKEGRREWPRRPLFAAVGSGVRTVRIGRAMVILQKSPYVFRKSTHVPQALSVYFAKSTSYYFEINPQSRSDGLRVFFQKRPFLYRKSTHIPETLCFFCENLLRSFSNQPTMLI
jgi:hypothetical protein